MASSGRKRDVIMARISKAQKYAVQYLYSQNTSIDDIVSDLKIPKTQVEKIIGETSTPKNKAKINNDKKSTNNARIMTPVESMQLDEYKKKHRGLLMNNNKPHIFKPKG